MTKKTIDTLVDDMYDVLNEETINNRTEPISEDNLKVLANGIVDVLRDRLNPRPEQSDALRMSEIGRGSRYLWYKHNTPREEVNRSITPATRLKFLYGDLIEQILLFLVREAGHTVEGEQGEVEINGVLGHQDCVIDGVPVDIKSVSPYGFPKFSKKQLFYDDPFGYIGQISGYARGQGYNEAMFLAADKSSGELAALYVPEYELIDPAKRIDDLKEIIAKPAPPEEKCYPEEQENKNSDNGNRIINKNCSYCPFKHSCWDSSNGGRGLRSFKYANGVKYFTQVSKEPRVEELI